MQLTEDDFKQVLLANYSLAKENADLQRALQSAQDQLLKVMSSESDNREDAQTSELSGPPASH